MQRPEKVYNISWGKAEARGAPPLMPDNLIHTWGTATFEHPKWLFPTMFTPTLTQPENLQATPGGAAGTTQGSTHAVDDHSAMGIG